MSTKTRPEYTLRGIKTFRGMDGYSLTPFASDAEKKRAVAARRVS